MLFAIVTIAWGVVCYVSWELLKQESWYVEQKLWAILMESSNDTSREVCSINQPGIGRLESRDQSDAQSHSSTLQRWAYTS